ncbi:MAG: gamma-glutamyl-gamma-aminobutyrate hydrolase family protein [Phycisphaerales bacterium]|nr:MAG: gamma-glutamyl-gamma-aminobutyrate hydrolase family protein [Phycisphaerales bacterium]
MKKVLTLLLLAILLLGPGCQDSAHRSRPLIGITSVYKVDEDNDSSAHTTVNFAYVRAVIDNGGAPVVLPTIQNAQVVEQYVRELDGLILVGGADIPPSAYNATPHATVVVMPLQRYDFERELIGRWWESNKPLLGVCLGMQFTNVVRGGTLVQDIPSQISDEVTHRGERSHHRVDIVPDSYLARILSAEQAVVYSSHHQAVDEVGNGLRVVAHSTDGAKEALERSSGEFGLFVQWHPEQMADTDHRDAIYGALIRACKSHLSRRWNVN